MTAALAPHPLMLEIEIDPAVTDSAQQEAHRAELEKQLQALPDVQSVATEPNQPMGGVWGAIVEMTPYAVQAGAAIGGLAGLLKAVRSLLTELGVWRDAYIRVGGKRKRLDALETSDIATLSGDG